MKAMRTMRTMKSLTILMGLCLLQASVCAQSLDDVFKRADKAKSKTEQSVNGSVHSDISKANSGLKEKVDAGDERARAANEASAASANDSAPAPSASPKSTSKVFSCKFYCKSASGPTTYSDFTANSRKEAAGMAADAADRVCDSKGYGYASHVKYSDSQCSAK
jgi:hypothetical protein